MPRTERSTPSVGEREHGEAVVDLERSFEQFFADEYRRVVALAVALCHRPSIAEELAQDAFVKAFSRWDRICRYDDPAAWVRRVAVNLAMSSLRRRSREVRMLARVALHREGPSPEPAVGDEVFWSAVRRLPRREAQCVTLRYLDDCSTSAIAAVLDIAESTVRVHLHNARLKLATVLGEDLDEEAT